MVQTCAAVKSVPSKVNASHNHSLSQGSSKKWLEWALILVQLFFLRNFLGAWLFLFTAGFMSWRKPWGISLSQSTWYWELANCFQVFLKSRLGSALPANWHPAVTLFFFFHSFLFCFVLPLVKKLKAASFKRSWNSSGKEARTFFFEKWEGVLSGPICYQAAGGWAAGKWVRVQG